MKILIIEDDATTREFVSKGLTEHGYIVDQAEDGKKGLMMALSSEYQLIILDRMLPYLSGMKVLAAIKATEEQLPVLILSAMDSVSDRIDGLQAGSDDYLIKPFALAELIARVDIIINRTQRPTSNQHILNYHCLKVDLKAHKVMCNQQEIILQPNSPKNFILFNISSNIVSKLYHECDYSKIFGVITLIQEPMSLMSTSLIYVANSKMPDVRNSCTP